MNPTVDEAQVWDPLSGRTLSSTLDVERLSSGWIRRDALSAARIVRVLQEMGAFTERGERRTRYGLAAEIGVAGHTALFEVLLDLVVAAGFLEVEGPDLVAAETVGALADRDLVTEGAALMAEHPEVAGHMRLLDACLAEYSRMLRGQAKPLSVLFPGWSMDLVMEAYRGEPISDRLNEIAAEAVAQRVFAHTRAEPLRILEVGAGTGGTTTSILQAVAPATGGFVYTYTDISTSFLRHGKQQFAPKVPTMRFERLDIEVPPSGQGFEDGGYDLVVAANVLHATRDLRRTLQHATSLLAPGGRLVLREVTTPLMFITMSFGLLDGWWSAQDDLRIPGSPLADVPTWTKLLTEAGFARVAALPPTATGDKVFRQHILVAER
jgi:SAM-dependent methyltransferase